jgi:tight adherence protein B
VTGAAWPLALCLLTGAALVAWPTGAVRALLGAGAARTRLSAERARGPLGAGVGRRGWSRAAGPLLRSAVVHVLARPRRAVASAVVVGALGGWLLAGPVASLLAAVYGALAARATARAFARRRASAARSATLDDLAALAADLRAGLPPPDALPASPAPGATATGASGRDSPGWPGGSPRWPTGTGRSRPQRPPRPARGQPAAASAGAGPPPVAPGARPSAAAPGGATLRRSGPGGSADRPRLSDLTSAVWRLAERTGAPAADLVERIEADARAADRSLAAAEAQAAGARATALLLAVLPVGGVALGYGIGVDPLAILLHTTLGAACAAGAALLQSGGLLWADRLTPGGAR